MKDFREQRKARQPGRPLRDADRFLAGQTVAEFFVLPEKEQSRVWEDDRCGP